MPKDRDLDVAFIIADEDGSNGIDIDEFLNLYKLMKKGEVSVKICLLLLCVSPIMAVRSIYVFVLNTYV
jgi:hypothetical protein